MADLVGSKIGHWGIMDGDRQRLLHLRRRVILVVGL